METLDQSTSKFRAQVEADWATDETAAAWQRHHADIKKQMAAVTQAVVDAARPEPGMTILDLASGTGEPSLSLARKVAPGGKVVATDLNSAMLSALRHNAASEGIDNVETQVVDANEIHVPTRTPVLVELASNDVIHSLWVPNLGGKKDLIPRYKDTVWFQADRPGVYRGQCAEFCGHQHAKMGLHVVAHSPDEFARWQEQARMPSRVPSDTLQRRGREVFLSGPCILCHAIAGTPAGSRAGR